MNNNNLSLIDNDTAKDALEKNLSEISNKMYNNWTKYFLSRDDKCMLVYQKLATEFLHTNIICKTLQAQKKNEKQILKN